MVRYQFSTVKLVPDIAKNEPVNIGIILYDQEKNVAYPKFTTNWKEVEERTTISTLPNLKEILNIREMPTDNNYLQQLSHKEFQDNLVITEPKTVSVIESPFETVEKLFETQISIPSLGITEEDKKTNQFGKWMDVIINKMLFPMNSIRPKYVFRDTIVERIYPYVFVIRDAPVFGIEYLSFHPGMLNTTKVKYADIRIIRDFPTHQKTQFKIFATQEKDEINQEDKQIKKSLELLNVSDIPVIYRNDTEYELDKIRKAVAIA